MTDQKNYESLKAHLEDLRNKSETWHKNLYSSFLNEEEQAAMLHEFPESERIRYEGGYPGARKKRVIFLDHEENDFSDIVCISSRIDQRFRKITHRDVLGALMHLQIDRHSFGDFWVCEDAVHLYTSSSMADFLMQNLTRINQLNVRFEINEERPVQQFRTKRYTLIAASLRMDAIVSAITHSSRAQAKEMIRAGLVQLNHIVLVSPDKLCDNNDTISIRGKGRFRFIDTVRKTNSDRIAIEIEESI